ncbi:MAG: hypothetical protein AAB675_03385 [Patescibacteria group bacterium]
MSSAERFRNIEPQDPSENNFLSFDAKQSFYRRRSLNQRAAQSIQARRAEHFGYKKVKELEHGS